MSCIDGAAARRARVDKSPQRQPTRLYRLSGRRAERHDTREVGPPFLAASILLALGIGYPAYGEDCVSRFTVYKNWSNSVDLSKKYLAPAFSVRDLVVASEWLVRTITTGAGSSPRSPLRTSIP